MRNEEVLWISEIGIMNYAKLSSYLRRLGYENGDHYKGYKEECLNK
jgi:hypothetical protein